MPRSLLALAPLPWMVACGDDTVLIQSSTWILTEAWAEGSQLGATDAPAGSMVVDADAGTVEIRDGGAAVLATADLLPRDPSEWPTDCPTGDRLTLFAADTDELGLTVCGSSSACAVYE